VKTLAQQLDAYEAYHRDPRNKLTHFFGVPLATFAILLILGWLRFAHAPEVPYTGATLFYLVVFLYYLRLDWQVALWQAPFTLTLLWPFAESLLVFLAAFLGGWVIQLVGHAIEGRRPALADNLLQIFNAPLFLTAEVAFFLGYRQDLRGAVGQEHAKPLTADAAGIEERGPGFPRPDAPPIAAPADAAGVHGAEGSAGR
jgi:uncharacterized membrane protein YGL010W